MTIPRPLREHPLEALLAAGLLLSLLLGASDGVSQKSEQNQSVSACQADICQAARPAS